MEGRLISKKLIQQTHRKIRFYVGNKLRRTDRAHRKSSPCLYHLRPCIRVSSKYKCAFFRWKEGLNKKVDKANLIENLFLHQKEPKPNGISEMFLF